jgi:L-aspartate oxidase
MSKYAPDAMELAPRDVVARAIHQEMAAGGYDYVLLDIASQRDPDFICERFPTLVENAALIGLDATRDPLPVVPIAHYSCGGVRVDEWGRTNVPGLYAIGEVSSTGLHGANRLASTSLLEGLVWGDRAARHISENPRQNVTTSKPVQQRLVPVTSEQIATYWQQMQRIMWENVGIVRTESQLACAKQRLGQLSQEVEQLYQQSQWDDVLIGLRNALQTAHLVAAAAYNNPISRGAHYRSDTLLVTPTMEHVL